MKMLRNNHFTAIFAIICMQSCFAQNQQIKTFFDSQKKSSYQDCFKESEIDKIKNGDENKEFIELMIKGCKDRGIIFDNFIDATVGLQKSLPKEDNFIIYNWKKYDTHIPAPSITLLQTDKTTVIEFTYYDDVNNSNSNTLKKKIYKEKEGKFKNEILYIHSILNGKKMDHTIDRYSRNDYYIIKKIEGKFLFYTLINGNLERVQ